MHPQRKKGIIISAILYGIAFIISYIIYLTVEITYAHGPSPHHAVFILLFYMAVIWCIISLLLILLNKSRQLHIGFIIVNGGYLLVCLFFILYAILEYKINY